MLANVVMLYMHTADLEKQKMLNSLRALIKNCGRCY